MYYSSHQNQLKNGSRTTGSLKSNGCYEGVILNCVEYKLSRENDLTYIVERLVVHVTLCIASVSAFWVLSWIAYRMECYMPCWMVR